MSYPLFTKQQILGVRLEPGDILCVAGVAWISSRIMRRTRRKDLDEEMAPISHVGMVTGAGTIRTATVTEAAEGTVLSRRIGEVYRGGQGLAVMRPANIPPEVLELIVEEMLDQVDETYGYGDIVAHLLATIPGLGWTRRFITDSRPICSQALDRAMRPFGYNFGRLWPVPRDVWDFGLTSPHAYWWPMETEGSPPVLRALP